MEDGILQAPGQQALTSLCATAGKGRAQSELSPFLNLPAEIRNTIYDLHFVHSGPIRLDHDTPGRKYRASPSFPGIGLLAACRQIHAEAVGLLYGHNTFVLTARGSLMFDDWLIVIRAN
jgi:hypothetical protein